METISHLVTEAQQPSLIFTLVFCLGSNQDLKCLDFSYWPSPVYILRFELLIFYIHTL